MRCTLTPRRELWAGTVWSTLGTCTIFKITHWIHNWLYKNNTSGGERSTCPIKTKKSLDLFKVRVIPTVFFQTSWNVVFQASIVAVMGVCFALTSMKLHLWTPFIFINYRISGTNNPNLMGKKSFFKQLLKNNAVQCRVNVIQTGLLHPKDQLTSLQGQHKGSTKAQRRRAKPFCLLPKGLWLRPGKGVNEMSVGQQTALPVTKHRTVFQPELFKAIWMGVRRSCWSAAQTPMYWGQRRMRAIRQQETHKHWPGPHTCQVQWPGWELCSPSYRPKQCIY